MFLILSERMNAYAKLNDLFKPFVRRENAAEFGVDGKLLNNYRHDDLQHQSYSPNDLMRKDSKSNKQIQSLNILSAHGKIQISTGI